MTGIQVRNVTAGYGDREVLHRVSVDLPSGGTTAVIGPNGCGKSTLLRCVARLMPAEGEVLLDGRDLRDMPRRTMARLVGVLPQTPLAPEGITVKDLVARGRHPHQTWLAQWSSDDDAVIREVLDLTGSLDLADRRLEELSGGQRQRVWISMVLAQQTPVLLLDEPTTYLDLSAAVGVLNLVKRLSTELGRTVVMVLHDLNLAARYADHLVVLHDGRVAAAGDPRDVLEPELLREVFELDALVVPDPVTGGPLIVPSAPLAGDASIRR